MATVLDLQDNLSAIEMHREAKSAIGRTSEFIADLNVEQLEKGLTSEGKRLPRYRNKTYARFKNAINPLPGFGNPDLILTGAFTKSFKIDVGSEDLEVVSNDIHDLSERYGEDIYGLSDDNQEFYNQEIFLPELAQSIENITGLKMLTQ
jgi:hypothetical protein